MKRSTIAACLSVALLFGAGCHEASSESGLSLPLEKSAKTRILRAELPADQAAELRRGNLDLGFQLLKLLGTQSNNVVVSAVGLQNALGMAHLMARGDAKTSIAKAAQLSESPYEALSYLDQELESRNLEKAPDVDAQILKSTNQVVLDTSLDPSASFLDTLGENFGTGVYKADFKNKSTEVRSELNAWISDRTANKIPELLKDSTVNDRTRWLLINALYFKSPWGFSLSAPVPQPFNLLDGKQVEVPTLVKHGMNTAYASDDSFQWANLPLRQGTLALMVILPTAGQFDSSRAQLSAERIEQMRKAMRERTIDLEIPELTMNTGVMNLVPALKTLGLGPALSASADFGGFTDQEDHDAGPLQAVVQQVVFAMDRHGIEAAAATAAAGTAKGSPGEDEDKVEFFVNRPYYFVLVDQKTGVALFTGQVTDPRGG